MSNNKHFELRMIDLVSNCGEFNLNLYTGLLQVSMQFRDLNYTLQMIETLFVEYMV